MRHFLAVILFFVGGISIAQNDLLAKNYFEQGEYEKALSLYKKLVAQTPGNNNYFIGLIKTYQQLEQFQEAESRLEERLNTPRPAPDLFVELGHNFTLQQQDSLANVQFRKAIDFVKQNPVYTYIVGRAFTEYSLLDEAIIVYEWSMQTDPSRDFYLQLAQIYGEKGDLEKMFEMYLSLIKTNPDFGNSIKRSFSQYIDEDPLNESNQMLRKALLKKLQQDPDVLYNELLSWLFIQQKEYKKAFVQEKAIYTRRGETLEGLIDLGRIALEDEHYGDAKEIVQFIVDRASNIPTKIEAYQQLMLIEINLADKKDFPKIDQQFKELFQTYGNGRETYALQLDYNDFLAYQFDKKEEAIQNLKALTKQDLSVYQEARVKLKLADILVFDERFNEALIYYSQVQNKVKNDVLAQEARFKVARTSYFKGDFQWAQVQLDVLKKSASQLIANDAMQLSLMISDNSLEDSTQTALRKYAKADLRDLQHHYQEASDILKDLLLNNKGEAVEDEALLKLGSIYEKLHEYPLAETQYLKLIELYNDDILADDAHFRLGLLYQNQLAAPQKAKEQFEIIIFDFEDSIYFVEARKRFRMLRGDEIN
ncbi:MAG TPA: tetratricopeptide repeat protein [Flavobacteriaceae bacterium]|nr:tetratricopeptide repeat protein [Flavobacteriaceae bacterium]MCB9212170.1 tetratricopeptide repeat protein [Alteromonas sp.]HPF10452.1 tetratricopeptide repeat protein [Flavobacteriaceae bacterium]HQU21761.1 tetratricopeptide repeat protein [Flavobacteriaceae bacterium]HQU64663.1 tetratricopeptide repeat protein [Flavobacteriaceae bacterium]